MRVLVTYIWYSNPIKKFIYKIKNHVWIIRNVLFEKRTVLSFFCSIIVSFFFFLARNYHSELVIISCWLGAWDFDHDIFFSVTWHLVSTHLYYLTKVTILTLIWNVNIVKILSNCWLLHLATQNGFPLSRASTWWAFVLAYYSIIYIYGGQRKFPPTKSTAT